MVKKIEKKIEYKKERLLIKLGLSAIQMNKSPEDQKQRFFVAYDENDQTIGTFTGETPKQAASKAFTALMGKTEDESLAESGMKIYLKEIAPDGNKKIYGYDAKRKKLDYPIEVTTVDKKSGEKKVITYQYENQIKKIAVPESMS